MRDDAVAAAAADGLFFLAQQVVRHAAARATAFESVPMNDADGQFFRFEYFSPFPFSEIGGGEGGYSSPEAI